MDGTAHFGIKVTPRAGKLPSGGKLYFRLTSSYAGDEDISFNGTVAPNGDNDAFVPRPDFMPYIAGMRAEGLEHSAAVAELTSDGATLGVEIYGYNAANSAIINFIKAISVEYAWVDEAV
jgi:hypothetical protein